MSDASLRVVVSEHAQKRYLQRTNECPLNIVQRIQDEIKAAKIIPDYIARDLGIFHINRRKKRMKRLKVAWFGENLYLVDLTENGLIIVKTIVGPLSPSERSQLKPHQGIGIIEYFSRLSARACN